MPLVQSLQLVLLNQVVPLVQAVQCNPLYLVVLLVQEVPTVDLIEIVNKSLNVEHFYSV